MLVPSSADTPAERVPRREASRADAPSLRVAEVTTLDGLRALAPTWDDLHERSETRSPFLSHAWALSWWEAFGANHELRVLTLSDDDGPAAIIPLALARRRLGPITYRSLELIGTGPLRFLGMGLADRADALLARRHVDVLAELVRWLAAQRATWDVVDLRFVPEDSTTVRALPELARAAGLGCCQEPCAQSPYLPLTGTFDDYAAARGGSFRKGLRRRIRALEDRGAVRLELDAARRTDPLEAFASVVDISLASWKADAGSGLFQHEAVRRFFEHLLPRLAERDGAYLALLHVGGRAVAHELGFRWDGKLWSYDSAFRREEAKGSPGFVLTARVLEEAWSDGLREYDFMRGNEGYKATWGGLERREVQLVLDSGTPRARLARVLGFQAKWALKRRPWLVNAQGAAVGALNRILVAGRRRDA